MPVAVPEVAAATGPLDFAQFMTHISGQMQKRDAADIPLVHTDYLTALTTEISNAFIAANQITTPLAGFTDIGGSQAMIDYAVQLMQRDGRW